MAEKIVGKVTREDIKKSKDLFPKEWYNKCTQCPLNQALTRMGYKEVWVNMDTVQIGNYRYTIDKKAKEIIRLRCSQFRAKQDQDWGYFDPNDYAEYTKEQLFAPISGNEFNFTLTPV